MKRKRLLVLLGLFLPVVSVADAPGYLAATLSRVAYEESGGPDAQLTTAGLRLGAALNRHFSLEFRFGFGIEDDSVLWNDLEINNYFGGYARFMLPVNEQITLYALIGGTRAKLTASNNFMSVEDIEKGSAYGAGAEIDLGVSGFASLEYARLLSGDDYDLNAWTIGLGRRF